MRKFKYAKIPSASAKTLGLQDIRIKDEKGWYTICQSDLNTYGEPGDTFEDKVAKLKGKII